MATVNQHPVPSKTLGWKITELPFPYPSHKFPCVPAKLTTHVLDTTKGCPARGVRVELWRLTGTGGNLLKTATTNGDGRTDEPLLGGPEFVPGEYELVFYVGDYFATPASGQSRFLDKVPVRFGIANATVSYHVPLLCSPWAYSTYLGS